MQLAVSNYRMDVFMKFYQFGGFAAPVIMLLPVQKLMEKKRTPYRDRFMEMFGIGNGGLPFIKKQSVYNQFYSDLVTPLNINISVKDTTIHCFYAKKMGKKYLQRYKKHFRNPVIHTFDMEHEELLVLHPQQWAKEIKEICL